ncbi:DNA repair protein RadA [Candidatus Methylospira mobilis]|uniref:DNA repair protein RadA n=1 Tax=Candidatus Methylospira mobilis TaxID=1808979 RepID=A0A5Q0BL24_9GAMM|nr:DNA repair protein RadA [Candidatus Methylospira mobilis]QFY42817.1 DNA repair protein RadA [Candidatus Methylospira mobilis]
MSRKDSKSVYRCAECGHVQNKWAGQCQGCGLWNTLMESVELRSTGLRHSGYAGEGGSNGQPVDLASVKAENITRSSSGMEELDRVLGGGLVPGSAVLIGGDPGIGKSTLLLQTLCGLRGQQRPLYITGEESMQQVSLRASRLGLDGQGVQILAETSLENIIQVVQQHRPGLLVVDSIQTVYSGQMQSAPGSVAQVRECAAHLVRLAKQTGTIIFLVGHVTKEGALAGPRVLEHMVDTVLYFEGDPGNRYRIIRAFKNRFGAVNELGVFAMTETGLKEVRNPSAIFLSRYEDDMVGSVVMVMREGSRSMLVEVQALVNESPLAAPRRIAVGMEQNRLAMLLAILHKHGGIGIFNQDVFINMVGGLRLTETAGDLAVALAVLSSYRERPLPKDWCVFGELGLSGEVRPVPNGEERLREAAKHGFRHAVVPLKNAPKGRIDGLELIAVKSLQEALAAV